MAYYRGDYYRGKGKGDYYRGRKGDPGFWSAIGRGLGVVGAAIAAPYTGGASLSMIPALLPGGMPKVPALGQGGIIPNSSGEELKALIRGQRGQVPAERPAPNGNVIYGQDISAFRRRRHMNPGNVKALRRSLRRVSSFGRLCKSARKAIGQAATAVQVRRPMRMLRSARAK